VFSSPRRGHVRTAARCGWAPALAPLGPSGRRRGRPRREQGRQADVVEVAALECLEALAQLLTDPRRGRLRELPEPRLLAQRLDVAHRARSRSPSPAPSESAAPPARAAGAATSTQTTERCPPSGPPRALTLAVRREAHPTGLIHGATEFSAPTHRGDRRPGIGQRCGSDRAGRRMRARTLGHVPRAGRRGHRLRRPSGGPRARPGTPRRHGCRSRADLRFGMDDSAGQPGRVLWHSTRSLDAVGLQGPERDPRGGLECWPRDVRSAGLHAVQGGEARLAAISPISGRSARSERWRAPHSPSKLRHQCEGPRHR
jgi:hypothetical protein